MAAMTRPCVSQWLVAHLPLGVNICNLLLFLELVAHGLELLDVLRTQPLLEHDRTHAIDERVPDRLYRLVGDGVRLLFAP